MRLRRAEAGLTGTAYVPGDKSISHRSVMFASIADGTSHIRGFLDGHDCLATVGVMRGLGVEIQRITATELHVGGRGLDGLREPERVLDCANSGTTMRLIAGLLAGRPFNSVLVGTDQLQNRPMARIVEPLGRMGARIIGRKRDTLAPLAIEGGTLRGITFSPRIASAQVKSAILLAGLSAEGRTTIHEAGPSRDHTERMLAAMGAPIEKDDDALTVTLDPLTTPLSPFELDVPGDPSSAAFLMVAAAIVPDSDVTLPGVSCNPTRTGLVDALLAMDAGLELTNRADTGGEPHATYRIRHQQLQGAAFGGDHIVRMIDEIPILAVAATQAEGTTEVVDAAELRVKETDRIATTARELRKMGAEIDTRDDGMVIHGPTGLTGATVSSHGDHRLAMALAVAGLAADGETIIEDAGVFADSFPGFDDALAALGAHVVIEDAA